MFLILVSVLVYGNEDSFTLVGKWNIAGYLSIVGGGGVKSIEPKETEGSYFIFRKDGVCGWIFGSWPTDDEMKDSYSVDYQRHKIYMPFAEDTITEWTFQILTNNVLLLVWDPFPQQKEMVAVTVFLAVRSE